MQRYLFDISIVLCVGSLVLFFVFREQTNDISLVFRDDQGQSISITEPAIVHFWSTWSKPSHRDIQVLQRLHKKHPDIQVLGIYSSTESVDDLRVIKNEMGIYYPLGITDSFPQTIPLTIVLYNQKKHVLKESLQYELLMELFQREF